MTWLEAIGTRKLVPSIFSDVADYATQNDELHQLLQKLMKDTGSINDLYHRQRLSRDLIIYILEQRIRRRLRR